jgi:hypothetical protein
MNDTHELREALTTLSTAQLVAVAALADGATHAAAAQAAGVARETVSRWTARHPGFRVALDETRHALWHEQSLTIARVRAQAADTIAAALDRLAAQLDADAVDPIAVVRVLTPFAGNLTPTPTPRPVTHPTDALNSHILGRTGNEDLSLALADPDDKALRRLADTAV